MDLEDLVTVNIACLYKDLNVSDLHKLEGPSSRAVCMAGMTEVPPLDVIFCYFPFARIYREYLN